jgi:alginate O-acetyltransferase complex protein AlgI
MNFISIEFFLLFSVVLTLLALIRRHHWRKCIILLASCTFYAYWDWRFLGLLGFVTVLDYYISRSLVSDNNPAHRKTLLVVSIIANLGFLAFFKYFNFFIDNLNVVLSPLGWNFTTLNIILPIGISFYTFETLSYVIDIYRGVAKPANSLLDYAVFITFFPRLVAGPIMRAAHFLPQLEHDIVFSSGNLVKGSQFFLRGMLKKLVIADSAAIMVDQIYNSPSLFSPSTVWLAILAYSIQIFCDFSGYTDMALGIGLILGFDLPENFKSPYTAQSITEFWQRWHISLSTWLRDYLYIPLGGNRKGKLRTYINLFLTMLLGGLWHGASWNFVLWGGIHGLYLAVERLTGLDRSPGSWKNVSTWLRAALTFLVVSITWVFFRSPSLAYTGIIFGKLLFINSTGVDWFFVPACLGILIVILGGFASRFLDIDYPSPTIDKSYTLAFMLFELLIVYFFAPLNASPFIYFQF